jgi:SAM-dependent methyltransferase
MANSPNSTNGASLSANTDRGVRVSEPLRFPDKRSREEARAYFQPFLKYFRGRHAVVDVACGQGHFLELLKEAGVEGVGVEVDAELCAVCREKGLPVIHDDLFVHLRSVAPGTYDAAHVSHIIEHLPPPQVAELFRLLHRILPPGAPMVVLTPNIANLHQVAGYFWHEPPMCGLILLPLSPSCSRQRGGRSSSQASISVAAHPCCSASSIGYAMC